MALTDYHLADLPDEERAAWRIHSDREAAWSARKMRQAKTELDRINAEADAAVIEAEEFRRAATTGPAGDYEFFRSKLIDYRMALEELAAGRDEELPKTYPVLGAKLTRRQQPGKTVVVDEAAFAAWALANQPAAVKVTPLTSKLAGTPAGEPDPKRPYIGRCPLVTEGGEVVPGVEFVRDPDKRDATLT